MDLGPTELLIILAIVVIIFGVGRLPEVGGAIGRGIKEFRKSTRDDVVESRAEPVRAPASAAGGAPAAGPGAPPQYVPTPSQAVSYVPPAAPAGPPQATRASRPPDYTPGQ